MTDATIVDFLCFVLPAFSFTLLKTDESCVLGAVDSDCLRREEARSVLSGGRAVLVSSSLEVFGSTPSSLAAAWSRLFYSLLYRSSFASPSRRAKSWFIDGYAFITLEMYGQAVFARISEATAISSLELPTSSDTLSAGSCRTLESPKRQVL